MGFCTIVMTLPKNLPLSVKNFWPNFFIALNQVADKLQVKQKIIKFPLIKIYVILNNGGPGENG